MNLLTLMRSLFQPVLTELAPDKAKVPELLAAIKPSNAPTADYQANFAMGLSRMLGVTAREAAERVAAKLPTDMIEPPTIGGPADKPALAFVNVKFKDSWLAAEVRNVAPEPRLGAELAAKSRIFVIDYSSPNVAKPLHVGHLRSTIIGDALTRILSFVGHRVITDNHLGDWGLQFGILIYGYKNFRNDAAFKAD